MREGQHFVLQPLESRAKTSVNGQTISKHRLQHGDRILLGKQRTELLFLLDDEEAATKAGTLRGMTVVLESLRVLGSASIVDGVLERVLDTALEATGAERAFVLLPDKSGALEHIVGRTSEGESLSKSCLDTSRKVPEQVFRSGKPEVVADLAEQPGAHMRTMALGIRAVICLPLRRPVPATREATSQGASGMLGVLYLDSARKRARLLAPPTLQMLEVLAAEAAVAIENAELYRRNVEANRVSEDLGRAREIQSALMPQQLTSTDAFRMSAVSLPCRAIGGDFLDLIEFSSGRLGVAVGDVAGKGPPAAILAAHLQGLVSASVGDGLSPERVLDRVNRDLLRRGLDDQFATFFYAVLSPDGRVAWCNAGHPHPFVVKGDGQWERLGQGHLPLGVLQEAKYKVAETRLLEGDRLVIFSDGVSEATNPADEWFGEERLLACVHEADDSDTKAVVERTLRSLETFTSGAPLADDVTLVVVGRRPTLSAPGS